MQMMPWTCRDKLIAGSCPIALSLRHILGGFEYRSLVLHSSHHAYHPYVSKSSQFCKRYLRQFEMEYLEYSIISPNSQFYGGYWEYKHAKVNSSLWWKWQMLCNYIHVVIWKNFEDRFLLVEIKCIYHPYLVIHKLGMRDVMFEARNRSKRP